MKSKITNERKKRRNFKNNEMFMLVFDFFNKNLSKLADRKFDYLFLNLKNFLYRQKNIKQMICFKNRCIFGRRSRAVFKNLRLSRIGFRFLVLNGLVVGFRKSSF